MSKLKIKISGVNNLTDARYFSAWGVDYIGFCIDPTSAFYCEESKIVEIRDWLEGPEYILEFPHEASEDEIITLTKKLNIQHIHLNAFEIEEINAYDTVVFKDFLIEQLDEFYIAGINFPVLKSDKPINQFTEKEFEALSKICNNHSCFIDLIWDSVEDFKKAVKKISPYGLILRGGEEEKTGLKSYETMDTLFEFLEDNN